MPTIQLLLNTISGGRWILLLIVASQSVVLRIEREAINDRIGEGIKEGAVKILAPLIFSLKPKIGPGGQQSWVDHQGGNLYIM